MWPAAAPSTVQPCTGAPAAEPEAEYGVPLFDNDEAGEDACDVCWMPWRIWVRCRASASRGERTGTMTCGRSGGGPWVTLWILLCGLKAGVMAAGH